METQNLKTRLKSKTPIWFKRIIKISITVAAAGVALLGAEAAIPGFNLPEQIKHVAQWMVVAGLVGAAVSKTAKQ